MGSWERRAAICRRRQAATPAATLAGGVGEQVHQAGPPRGGASKGRLSQTVGSFTLLSGTRTQGAPGTTTGWEDGNQGPKSPPRANEAHPPGWLGGSADTGCGQLRFLAVAAAWPSRCGCHLTPGAWPSKSQDKTTWPRAARQMHTVGSRPRAPWCSPGRAHGPPGVAASEVPGLHLARSRAQGTGFTLTRRSPSPPESLPLLPSSHVPLLGPQG